MIGVVGVSLSSTHRVVSMQLCTFPFQLGSPRQGAVSGRFATVLAASLHIYSSSTE